MPILSIQFTLEPDEEADPDVVLAYARVLAEWAGLAPPDNATITVHKPIGIGPHRYGVTYGEEPPCPHT